MGPKKRKHKRSRAPGKGTIPAKTRQTAEILLLWFSAETIRGKSAGSRCAVVQGRPTQLLTLTSTSAIGRRDSGHCAAQRSNSPETTSSAHRWCPAEFAQPGIGFQRPCNCLPVRIRNGGPSANLSPTPQAFSPSPTPRSPLPDSLRRCRAPSSFRGRSAESERRWPSASSADRQAGPPPTRFRAHREPGRAGPGQSSVQGSVTLLLT